MSAIFAMYSRCDIVRLDTLHVMQLSSVNFFEEYSSVDIFCKFGGANWVCKSVKEKIRLLLTPLNSITDEHLLIISEIMGFNTGSNENNITLAKEVISNNNEGAFLKSWRVYQFLIRESYAVPLYFSDPNHPENGKSAIEIGIAVDETEFFK